MFSMLLKLCGLTTKLSRPKRARPHLFIVSHLFLSRALLGSASTTCSQASNILLVAQIYHMPDITTNQANACCIWNIHILCHTNQYDFYFFYFPMYSYFTACERANSGASKGRGLLSYRKGHPIFTRAPCEVACNLIVMRSPR